MFVLLMLNTKFIFKKLPVSVVCSSHVLTEDTFSQYTFAGRLYSKRLLTKTNHLPRWGERFVPGPRHVCVVEESVVDPEAQTITTYTRNIGYTKIMVRVILASLAVTDCLSVMTYCRCTLHFIYKSFNHQKTVENK